MKTIIFLFAMMTLAACSSTPKYYIQEGGSLQQVEAIEESDNMVILQKMRSHRSRYQGPRVERQGPDQIRRAKCDHSYYVEEVEEDDFSDCPNH